MNYPEFLTNLKGRQEKESKVRRKTRSSVTKQHFYIIL